MNRIKQIWEKGPDNYILPFLWMHGASDEKKKRMVEVIYESGARAVCLEARPHPDFVGSLWWHDVEVILEEAKKKDMKVWILDDAHFPTGLENGAAEHAPEKLKRICLTEQHMDILGPVSDLYVKIEERLNCDPETGEFIPEYYKEKVVEVLLGKTETRENKKIIITVFTVLLIIFILVAGIFIFVGMAFKNSEPFKHSIELIENNSEIMEYIGNDYKQTGMILGSINVSGDSTGNASIMYKIKGKNGISRIYVKAEKENGIWIYQKILFYKELGSTDVIDLLEEK